MSKSDEDFSDDFDESEEEDFHPKPKVNRAAPRPTKVTNHKRPPKTQEKVINLGSVGASSKKKLAKRPVSAGTVKKVNRPAVEYWNDSLRRTGVGLTPQASSGSLTGLNKKQRKDMAYSSTSHFLRQLAGAEKPKRSTVSESRAAPGTPSYKSPEEYYDDILDLKKQITNLNQDNSQMKSKVRRLEEDNLKKEREIEQLLDPTKSEELRRTLADRKPDAGVVIHSLKQKILKLEHQLKDREATHSRLQSELKTTKIDEMKLQVETFYKEIVRLNQLKTVEPQKSRNHRDEPVKENNNAKLKALQETVLRMNEKSFRLAAENKSLKTDLEKTLEDLAKSKDRQRKHRDRDHDDDRRSKHDRKGDRFDAETASLMSEIDSRHGDTEGKLSLEGSLAQRLDQLDKRETELLEDAEKQRKIIKQLKEDRGHYRKKAEDREREIKALKKELDALTAQFESDRRQTPRSTVTPRHSVLSNAGPETPRRGSRSVRGNRSRSPSVSSDKGSRYDDRRRELDDEAFRRARAQQEAQVERFREKHAACTIQRGWRDHRSFKKDRREEKDALYMRRDHEARVESFREGRAARKIQSKWKGYLGDREAEAALKAEEAKVECFRDNRAARKIQTKWKDYHAEKAAEEKWRRECEDRAEAFRRKRAASKIQSGWINHQGRKRDAEIDDTTEYLQSVFRGHLSRKGQMEAYRNRPPSRGASLYDDDETVTESELDSATELIQSNLRGHLARKERIRQSRLEDSDSEMDEAISNIQSAFRGHLFRKNQLSNMGLRSSSRSPSSSSRRGSHYRQKLDSAGEEEDDDDKQSHLSRGSRRSGGRDSAAMLRKPPASPRKYGLSSRRDEEDDDSDDDIIVTSSRRR